MTSADLLVDAFGRIRELVHKVVADLTPEQLAFRVDSDANSIAWLVWHLTRIQDDHIAGVADTEQVWTSDGWVERFGLPFHRQAHGYGHSSADVAAVQARQGRTLGQRQLAVGLHLTQAPQEQADAYPERAGDLGDVGSLLHIVRLA